MTALDARLARGVHIRFAVDDDGRLTGISDHLVHCPAWTEHVFVGAGHGPCAILAVGARSDRGVVYPVADVALRHGAGVQRETTLPRDAYADIPPDEPAPFDPHWLPEHG